MAQEYYMHKEHGYLVTWAEMMKEMIELYDGDDPTNWLNWEEYYEKVE